jgi:hypothetical protein
MQIGSTNLVSAGNTDVFIAKYDRRGELVWAKSIGASSDDHGYAAKTDPYGNIYFTGVLYSAPSFETEPWNYGGYTGYLAKYEPSGRLTWVRPIPYSYHLAVDRGGNAYTTAGGANTVVWDKYDANGALVYRQFGTTGPFWSNDSYSWSYADGIAVDAETNVYIAGSFFGSVTFTNAVSNNVVVATGHSGQGWVTPTFMVIKFNRDGKAVWGVQEGGYYESTGYYSNLVVAADDFGGVYAFASVLGSLMSYNKNGGRVWSKSVGTVADLAVFQNTNIFVAGNFFFLSLNGVSMTSFGAKDAYVGRVNTNGILQEARRAGGATNDGALALAVDKIGNVYITGTFQSEATFGTNILSSNGGDDLFIAKVETGVPLLSLARNGPELRLSWSVLADDFVLESSENLSDPFSASGLNTQTNGPEISVSVPIEERAFFRLKRK